MNIATGRQATVNELADMIGVVLGADVRKKYQAERTGDVHDSWADITAAEETRGWEPRVGLEEGLRLTVDALAA